MTLSEQFAEIKRDSEPVHDMIVATDRQTDCLVSACASGRSLRLPGQRWQQLAHSLPRL